MKDKTDYPKVLIVHTGFYRNNGRDITLETIFKKWPKDRIAIANTNLSIYVNEITDYNFILPFYKFNFFNFLKIKKIIITKTEVSKITNNKPIDDKKNQIKKILLNNFVRKIIEFMEFEGIYKYIVADNYFLKQPFI